MWFDDFRERLASLGDAGFYAPNYFVKVDSTNELIKRARTRHEFTHGPGGEISRLDTLAEGEKITPREGFLAVAEEQTAGKGRQGRSWASPAGEAVYFSFLLEPRFNPEHAPALTLVMGLSVAEAVRKNPGLDVRIKWPNDIVTGGRKICGILTEAQAGRSGLDYVVIGTGINVNNRCFPEELSGRATSLAIETGKRVSRAEVLAETLHYFHLNYKIFSRTGDMEGLIGQYNELLIDIGEKIRVEDPENPYVASSRGIDRYGRLIVEREDGSVTAVSSGEVSVRGIYGYV